MTRPSRILVLCILGFVYSVAAHGADALEPEFSIAAGFMQQLAEQNSLRFSMSLSMDARSGKVHTLSADCEIHVAGLPGESGEHLNPPFVVTEPPNLCKEAPSGTTKPSETKLRERVWPDYFDANIMYRLCDVIGFPRIYPEHLESGEGGANPPHFFEIHPALKVHCTGTNGEPPTDTDFRSFLKYYPGMKAMQPSSFNECLEKSRVSVRKDGDWYEFARSYRGSRCGNFARLSVKIYNPKWIRKIEGGHSALAVVSADGERWFPLKLYTYEGTPEDDRLGSLFANPQQPREFTWHGMMTYDYFSIIKTVRDRNRNWLADAELVDWREVQYPFALVVFGSTE